MQKTVEKLTESVSMEFVDLKATRGPHMKFSWLLRYHCEFCWICERKDGKCSQTFQDIWFILPVLAIELSKNEINFKIEVEQRFLFRCSHLTKVDKGNKKRNKINATNLNTVQKEESFIHYLQA